MCLRARNLYKLVTNSLLFNRGLNIQDGCQSWSHIAAIKIICVTLTTILRQLVLHKMPEQAVSHSYVLFMTNIIVNSKILANMDSAGPFSKYGPRKMAKWQNRSLKTYGRLADRGLTSLIKETTGGQTRIKKSGDLEISSFLQHKYI